MPRRNSRWDTHQSLGVVNENGPQYNHDCEPIPCRSGHICLYCGRPVAVAL